MASIDTWRSPLDPERVLEMRITHWQEDTVTDRPDYLAVEEPLEVRVQQRSLAIIMRTPGHDKELALGFLLSEGVINTADDVLALDSAVDSDGLPLANVVNVTLRSESIPAACQLDDLHHEATSAVVGQIDTFERHFAVSSSCGLCGRNSITDVMQRMSPLVENTPKISVRALYTLAEQLREQQEVFHHTGGLHAAALFSPDGQLQLVREDIGRHNAVDKLIGHGLMDTSFPYRERVLLVSGRTSFEIIQKAFIARIPCLVAISAPSSLAVEFADRAGITLLGFLRNRAFNVYTHARRIV